MRSTLPSRVRSRSSAPCLTSSVLSEALLGNLHDGAEEILRILQRSIRPAGSLSMADRDQVLDCLESMRESARAMPVLTRMKLPSIDWAAWDVLGLAPRGMSRDWREAMGEVLEHLVPATLAELRRHRRSVS